MSQCSTDSGDTGEWVSVLLTVVTQVSQWSTDSGDTGESVEY